MGGAAGDDKAAGLILRLFGPLDCLTTGECLTALSEGPCGKSDGTLQKDNGKHNPQLPRTTWLRHHFILPAKAGIQPATASGLSGNPSAAPAPK
ncbi:hypothetical protein GCM10010970_14940 [Silvimonas iriomotensis]|uniref:Uncharacterized protein n=1 Tax=Silvimonas iriomotensis TaxID=449662 RepID=A0ABQ2P8G7_9NEIS|nr:hypothetical protein GCM10010970_14940 [Silvimonas iriomotensis]